MSDLLVVSSTEERSITEILVEASPNGVMVTDKNGRIQMLNPSFRSMIPVVPDAIGRTPQHAVPLPILADALSPDQALPVEFTIQHGSRDLLIRVVALKSHGRLTLIQDISRLKQAERYRSDFVSSVSHELRNPTTSIVGYSETLLEEELEPLHRDMVETIHRNAMRLSNLFEDLLSLARLDARNEPMALRPIRLATVVTEVIDKWSLLAQEREVTFQTLVDRDIWVEGSQRALIHIIGNLVENAVKYSHQSGVVTVRARERNNEILLEVIDVGIGISPQHQERIFERFYRVDKGRSRDMGGTGLGLAIVKRLADAMRARLEVRSRLGSGSVFRLFLQPSESPEQG